MDTPADPTRITLERLLNLRHFQKRRDNVNHCLLSTLVGQIPGKRHGDGYEFDDLRPYVFGDDVRFIDWNVTARTGEPHLRLYRAELERNTTVLVDLTDAAFTGINRLRAVTICEISALLLWRAAETGDKVSAAVCTEEQFETSRPAVGDRGVLQAIRKVVDVFAQRREALHPAKQTFSESEAYPWIADLHRLDGNLMWVSHFDYHPPQSLFSGLNAKSMRRRLSCYWVRDAFERQSLPAGRYPYKSADGSQETVHLADTQRKSLGKMLKARSDELRNQFIASGFNYSEIANADGSWLSATNPGKVPA